jgi:hypothetical protein
MAMVSAESDGEMKAMIPVHVSKTLMQVFDPGDLEVEASDKFLLVTQSTEVQITKVYITQSTHNRLPWDRIEGNLSTHTILVDDFKEFTNNVNSARLCADDIAAVRLEIKDDTITFRSSDMAIGNDFTAEQSCSLSGDPFNVVISGDFLGKMAGWIGDEAVIGYNETFLMLTGKNRKSYIARMHL